MPRERPTRKRNPPAPRAIAAVPADLARALAQNKAAAHFERFPPSVKRGILAWIEGAKRPETRARRVAETARLAGWNVQINQWRW